MPFVGVLFLYVYWLANLRLALTSNPTSWQSWVEVAELLEGKVNVRRLKKPDLTKRFRRSCGSLGGSAIVAATALGSREALNNVPCYIQGGATGASSTQ